VQWQQNPLLAAPQEIFKKETAALKEPLRCANILNSPSLKSVKLELHAIARGVMFHHRALKIISPYRTAYFEYYKCNSKKTENIILQQEGTQTHILLRIRI